MVLCFEEPWIPESRQGVRIHPRLRGFTSKILTWHLSQIYDLAGPFWQPQLGSLRHLSAAGGSLGTGPWARPWPGQLSSLCTPHLLQQAGALVGEGRAQERKWKHRSTLLSSGSVDSARTSPTATAGLGAGGRCPRCAHGEAGTRGCVTPLWGDVLFHQCWRPM